MQQVLQRSNKRMLLYSGRTIGPAATLATLVLGGGMSNVDEIYEEIPSRWGTYVFSDRVDTKLVRNMHGDSSGVRGAAWLWPDK